MISKRRFINEWYDLVVTIFIRIFFFHSLTLNEIVQRRAYEFVISNRARKCVTINGVTPRDWSSLGSKRVNSRLDTRIIHNKIVYGICILHCCTLWFR